MVRIGPAIERLRLFSPALSSLAKREPTGCRGYPDGFGPVCARNIYLRKANDFDKIKPCGFTNDDLRGCLQNGVLVGRWFRLQAKAASDFAKVTAGQKPRKTSDLPRKTSRTFYNMRLTIYGCGRSPIFTQIHQYSPLFTQFGKKNIKNMRSEGAGILPGRSFCRNRPVTTRDGTPIADVHPVQIAPPFA